MRLISKIDRYLEDKNYQIILKANQINVMNFDEVIDFSTNKISIRCNYNTINIEGKNLIITKMLEDEILVEGKILNLRIN